MEGPASGSTTRCTPCTPAPEATRLHTWWSPHGTGTGYGRWPRAGAASRAAHQGLSIPGFHTSRPSTRWTWMRVGPISPGQPYPCPFQPIVPLHGRGIRGPLSWDLRSALVGNWDFTSPGACAVPVRGNRGGQHRRGGQPGEVSGCHSRWRAISLQRLREINVQSLTSDRTHPQPVHGPVHESAFLDAAHPRPTSQEPGVCFLARARQSGGGDGGCVPL